MKKLFIRFTVHVFRERLSMHVCASFPFDFEGGMWEMVVNFLIITILFTLFILLFLSY